MYNDQLLPFREKFVAKQKIKYNILSKEELLHYCTLYIKGSVIIKKRFTPNCAEIIINNLYDKKNNLYKKIYMDVLDEMLYSIVIKLFESSFTVVAINVNILRIHDGSTVYAYST
jgi:hypothetical protein